MHLADLKESHKKLQVTKILRMCIYFFSEFQGLYLNSRNMKICITKILRFCFFILFSSGVHESEEVWSTFNNLKRFRSFKNFFWNLL